MRHILNEIKKADIMNGTAFTIEEVFFDLTKIKIDVDFEALKGGKQ